MTPTRIAALFALSFVASAPAWADSAPITSVTLYPGSATVERIGAVHPGMTELEIGGLPANFDPQTLRAQASAGIQIVQIVSRDVGKVEAAGAREAELEARVQALQDNKDLLEADIKSAELERDYLARLNGAAAADRPQPYIDAKSVAGVAETIRRNAREALVQIQRTQVQVRELDKKIAALQRDLEKMRGGGHDQRNITISLVARQAGTVRLSYQVSGAGWKPAYRASLRTASSDVELERMAALTQRTGEDWSGVELRLSTGQPRRSPLAPEPQPRVLSYVRPTPVRAEPVLGYARAIAAPAPASAPLARPGGMQYEEDSTVQELQNTFDTQFAVPGRISLPSDGREISVALSTQTVPVKQRIRVVPRLEQAAYVTAEASRPAGIWLNGNMQLFRDGSYVGAMHWNNQASEQLRLPFGRDELVQVTVDRTGQQNGSAGLLSQQGQRQVADVYTIRSFHKTPVDLLVLESSPVSGDEDVKVRSSFAPQPDIERWEQRQGVVGWQKTLAPNDTLRINVGYTIRYPIEGTVIGLP